MFALNGILIHDLKDILFGFIIIDIINMQGDFCNIVTGEVKALIHKAERFPASEIERS